MNHFLRGVAQATAEAFDLPGPILEIGSCPAPGQAELGDLRSLFPGKPYTGVDIQAGPGVDVVASVEKLPWRDGSFGTVLALSTFEHVQRFWLGFEEIHRVLRPDGILLVACPFYFHIHQHPADYWRFSPQALRLLLEGYPSKIIGTQGPESRPANVWALACREDRPPITPEQHARYRTLLARHARMPLPWFRRMRLKLGAWMFGKGHFAPYLCRDLWQTHLCQGARRKSLSPNRERRARLEVSV